MDSRIPSNHSRDAVYGARDGLHGARLVVYEQRAGVHQQRPGADYQRIGANVERAIVILCRSRSRAPPRIANDARDEASLGPLGSPHERVKPGTEGAILDARRVESIHPPIDLHHPRASTHAAPAIAHHAPVGAFPRRTTVNAVPASADHRPGAANGSRVGLAQA